MTSMVPLGVMKVTLVSSPGSFEPPAKARAARHSRREIESSAFLSILNLPCPECGPSVHRHARFVKTPPLVDDAPAGGTNMKLIRCGGIGLGWFGEHHVDTLQQLPLVELAAVCTRTESRLKEVAGKYGVPKAYTDYKELLADKSIDMVSIVTHIKEHLAPTVDALAAGKHVFLEKPMADSMEDGDRIIAAAAKAGTCFMGGHICRFDT